MQSACSLCSCARVQGRMKGRNKNDVRFYHLSVSLSLSPSPVRPGPSCAMRRLVQTRIVAQARGCVHACVWTCLDFKPVSGRREQGTDVSLQGVLYRCPHVRFKMKSEDSFSLLCTCYRLLSPAHTSADRDERR